MNHTVILKTMAICFCLSSLLFANDQSNSNQPKIAVSNNPQSSISTPFILPAPKHAVFTGKMISGQQVNIVTENFAPEAAYLAELLNRKGVKVDQSNGLKILLKQSDVVKGEAYTLTAKSNQVTITAWTAAGINHGIHTLVQLFRTVEGKIVLSEGKINDAPAMKIRGVFLNLRASDATNPDTMGNLKSLFSALAELKINTLFLEFSSNVKYDSVKFPKTQKKAFSKAQLKELSQYARSLHLEIVPYFQYLSHTTWILDNPDNVKLLENPKNKTWHTAWCPTNPKTNDFIDAVLTETIDIFDPKYIHLSMDEISYGPFHHCDTCKKQEPSEVFKGAIIHAYDFLKQHGVRMIMYHDQLLPYPNKYVQADLTRGHKIVDSLPKDIIINVWDYSTDRQRIQGHLKYFTDKNFDVLGASFNRFKNIQLMAEECSANPKSLGMLATYWYFAGNWAKHLFSPDAAALTTLTAAYSWNPAKLSATDDLTYDPVTEFSSRCIGTPQDFTNFDQQPLALLGNNRVGNLSGNWPGRVLERSLSPLPATITSSDIKFNLNQDQSLLTVSGLEGDGFPLQALDINVNLKVKHLAFVHASGVPFNTSNLNYLFGSLKRPLVGHYQIFYTNGKTVNVPLKYRWNITDWNSRLSPVAGRNVYVDTHKNNIRFQLCSYLWTNPFPQNTIASIKLISNNYEGVTIACLAVTALSPSSQPIVLDDFAYSSIKDFKKNWQPTIPAQHAGKTGIQFKKIGDAQDEHILVLTAPADTKSDRISLDKKIALSEDTLLSHNLTFEVESNTPMRMGFYLGDGYQLEKLPCTLRFTKKRHK
ncbi:MAG: family 20 glycosylhydrolase [Phycisphaeraceae bacterium]|nr:family 20 glycosylhydrolase [Phycisphaeraceae bacterium]